MPFTTMTAYAALKLFSKACDPPTPVEVAPEPLTVDTTTPGTWNDIRVGAWFLRKTRKLGGSRLRLTPSHGIGRPS